MKVYLVGDWGPEHNNIISLHKTRKSALKAWNKRRLELLKEAKLSMKRYKAEGKHWTDMWERVIECLSCTDPKKIDNYPHETPYIEKREVEK